MQACRVWLQRLYLMVVEAQLYHRFQTCAKIPCKKNMKGSHHNLVCRLCNKVNEIEDQEHMMQNCIGIQEKGHNINLLSIKMSLQKTVYQISN